MIRERFELVFEHYQSDIDKFDTLPRPRKYTDLLSGQLLTETIPDELKALCELGAKYQFKGSVGLGNFAEIPHVCLFDTEITDSAQEGYYIVFLFDRGMIPLNPSCYH
jgi:5-methylcytosine-specific restriction enzyme A